MRFLDDLFGRAAGREDAPERACDRSHRRARLHEAAPELDRILPELDGVDDCFDSLPGEPARSVRVVVGNLLDPLRQLHLHVVLLERRARLELAERRRFDPPRPSILLVQPNRLRAQAAEREGVDEPAVDRERAPGPDELDILAAEGGLLRNLGVGALEKRSDDRRFRDRADGSLPRMAETETFSRRLPDLGDGGAPAISLVIPVFNEEQTLEQVCRQASEALDAYGRSFEVIVVDDGSRDSTWSIVERLYEEDPRIRGVRFKRNFGQHPAMHAGLVRARGDVVVTMDGDLQNEPSDLPKLIEAVEAGTDVASGRRSGREDSWGRTLPSKLINGMLRSFTRADISDFGCAFNAYSRDALTPVLGMIGKQKFTKALVLSAGASVVEVELTHRARKGRSRYSPLRLTRLALHVLAGFWPQPIQWAGVIIGVICGGLAFTAGAWATVVWVVQNNFPGLLYLGGLVLSVLAVQGFILALVGEYLGRIQRDVEGRPLYTIEKELV
jgi:undecaprenyl-phosphate 4-deoxy-4-formamido-L-arabinose transferase